MLAWTQDADGWRSNGYRITPVAPSKWLLLRNEVETAVVSLIQEPLAVARSLSEAKREAELLEAARSRAERRRRYLAQLAVIAAVTVLLLGVSSTQDVLVVLAAAVLSLKPLGGLIGAALWRHSYAIDDMMYQ